jgi:hypothetical protein
MQIKDLGVAIQGVSPDTPPTLFDLPNSPDAFGIVLPPPSLRRLKFSALEYTTARRAIIEYIKTYFPNDFNDFIASNGVIMMMEIFAALTGKITLRGDILTNDSYLPTATSEVAVANLLALINQKIRRQQPATADIEISLNIPVTTDIVIQPGLILSSRGADNKPVTYEIFRAPGDFTSNIIIPAGKRGVIAYGIEGTFASQVTFSSPGGPNQSYVVSDLNVLEAPIFVTVQTGAAIENWLVVYGPIEQYGPNDKVVEVSFLGDKTIFKFGDNVSGATPVSGQTIGLRYRIGGGTRGRIGVGQIDETRQISPQAPANAPVTVRFRNINPSSGGLDKETIEQAKKRAPRDFATHNSIVTPSDYTQLSTSYAHPVFGAVAKAMATVRTGKNANLVEVYCLAAGPNGTLVTPSVGLKQGLQTFITNLNVLTDSVVVLDGGVKPVDIDMTVVVNRNADATIVRTKVEAALDAFFNVANWSMGQPLTVSNIIETVNSIDGVSYVDLFKPADNILATKEIGSPTNSGIGFNEVIVQGSRTIRYYYEKAQPNQ